MDQLISLKILRITVMMTCGCKKNVVMLLIWEIHTIYTIIYEVI